MANSKPSVKDILAVRLAKISEQKQQGELFETHKQQENQSPVPKSHLAPRRHNTPDFFVIDVFDASLKDDLASMEHPLFALKAGDTKDRHYEYNGNTIDITPTSAGIATIHDKDVWIYCISALMAVKNRGEQINRTIRFTVYDFLVSTNRETGGRNYKLLKEAFDRLAGTRIITNIKTGGVTERRNFGLLDEVRIIYKDELDETSPMIGVEVTLPDWLYRSIEAKQVKTISPDYFRIRKPLDRRIYELCAKHCGRQPDWEVSIETLHKKSGSMATLRRFRQAIKELVVSNDLPDYRLRYDEKRDVLKVKNKDLSTLLRSLKI